MKDFWSILARETREHRLVALGALVLGLAPFGSRLFPGPLAGDRIQIAGALAAVAAAVTALFLGGSVLTRDLAERRLSFYFARPIRSWAIWGGKMAAAAAVSLATGALVLLPAGLADAGGLAELLRSRPAGLALGLLALLGILGLSHAASLQLRTRSSWLLLDLAGALAVLWLVLAARRPLVLAGIPGFSGRELDVLTAGYLALAIVLTLAALAAGALQVAHARTDARRAHRTLSLVFWSTALAGSLLFLAYSRWVVRVGPQDLQKIGGVMAAPRGPWVVATGPASRRPGFAPVFLLDTATGRSLRIDARPAIYPTTPFSDDGRIAVWLEQEAYSYRVRSLDLTEPGSRPAASPLSYDGPPWYFVVAPDGRHVAVVESRGRRLLVHSLPQGALVAAVPLHQTVSDLWFDGLQRVRFWSGLSPESRNCSVTEIELTTGTARTAPCAELLPADRHALPPPRYFPHRISSVLEDGRRVSAVRGEEGMELLVDLPGSAWRQSIRFPGTDFLEPAGQPIPNHLAVQVMKRGRVEPATYLVDLETGKARLLTSGLKPSRNAATAPPGTPATQLFFNDRELVRIDPETGRKTHLLTLY